MPSCLHQYLGLINIFVVIYSYSPSCPTSPLAKNSCEVTKLGHVDKQQVVGGGSHAFDARPNMNIRVQVMIISDTIM